MPDIDALNKEFMAEWPKRCESDEVVKFLRNVWPKDDNSFFSLSKQQSGKEIIGELISRRESEIKEQVLAEMKEPQDKPALPKKSLQEQIDKLSNFFMEKHSDKIRDGGAVDNAIYYLEQYFRMLKNEEGKFDGLTT